jgi:Ni,Fe-hydrogenase I cytochrome b subunit
LYYNIYNSGIATLTTGSLAKGIFEIAGTSCDYIFWFHLVGWLFVLFSILVLIFDFIKTRRKNPE